MQKKTNNSQRVKKSARSSRKAKDAIEERESFPVVAIGASAGGLEAFEQFFATMPSDSGIAFVLIPHLGPSHASMMADLLRRFTKTEVIEVDDGMPVEPDHVYVIPPNNIMSIHHGVLQLTKLENIHSLRMPIDFFFRSLAEDRGERAICVILSGTGTDGTFGLRAINGAGGMSMVQEPTTAKYDGMPKSAIDTGLVDFILPVEKMPAQIIAYVKHFQPKKARKVPTVLDKAPEWLQNILTILKTKTGNDFSLYKKSTVYRRIERRMNLHNIEDPSIYVRYLQKHPDEIKMLFKELLIVVTSFFRDHEAFAILKKKILPMLLENKPDGYSFRVWAPGCATGEEVYSIAIILHEYLNEFNRDFKIQIFGTDIDEDAINVARTGIYPSNIAIDVSPERLKRFFVKEDTVYRIKKEIRESVIFAIQNITRDAPFTKIDLISCRNLLIYFDSELQNRLLPLFCNSLKPGGVLFLGSSESIGGFVNLFTTFDKKWKFFQCKKSASDQVIVFPGTAIPQGPITMESKSEIKKSEKISMNELAQKMLLENFAPPCAIINEKGDILYIHGRTGKYLEPAHGKASLNILDMAREGLALELRFAIHKAISRKKDITSEGLQVKTNGSFQSVNVTVKRMDDVGAKQGLMMVVFEDVAPVKQALPGKRKGKLVQKDTTRIAALERELKYTKEKLKDTIGEQQSFVEELKSANEELQSTNEELQSTNEELETSKEELQSVNEELVTVNSELQSKIDQLSRAENDVKNLFNTIRIGIIYLDNNLHIRHFNLEATRVINLIPTDVVRPISHIVSNLEYEDLVADAQSVLDKLIPKEVEVQTKDKNWYLMRIMPYKTTENMIDGVVITFTNINEVKQKEEALRKLVAVEVARKYAEGIVETVREPLIVLDTNLHVLSTNRSFYEIFKVTRDEIVGKPIFELSDRYWDVPELRKLLEEILPKDTSFDNFKMSLDLPSLGKRTMLLNARRIIHEGVDSQMILLAIEDITNREQGINR